MPNCQSYSVRSKLSHCSHQSRDLPVTAACLYNCPYIHNVILLILLVIFIPTLTDRCVQSIVFRVVHRWSVSTCFHACVRSCVHTGAHPVTHLTNQWTRFHQTLVDDVIEATDELTRFWRSKVKIKVTARSDIWVSYCGGRRHPYWRLGVEVSSSSDLRTVWNRSVWHETLKIHVVVLI